MINHSLITYFINATFIIKIVMLTLLLCSILSWAIIIQKIIQIKIFNKAMEDFYNNFYTKYDDLDIMYKYTSLNIKNNAQVISNYCHIFNSGYEEYEAAKNVCFNANDVSLSIDNIAGAMDISTLENESFLKKNLTILSTIGSNSPYIGLFGTVLGIMNAFSSLSGINEQVTIAMIAPGISEALIATAMGLLAAIPAVIGYNKLIDSISEAMHKSSSITEDFVIIFRKKLLININDNI